MMPRTSPFKNPRAALLAALLLVSCCVLPVSAVAVTDDAGTTVTLNATPQRIVSLAPSNTEILAALDLTGRLVGITDVCNYPPEVNTVPRIGGYSSISTEKVSAARPDLVIASDITPAETTARLRALGLNVVVVAPRNIDDMIRDIRMVGALTGTDAEAERLAANLSLRLAAVGTAERPAGTRPAIAHVVWNNPLYVSGNNTLQNDVIEHAGGKNAFAGISGWGTVTLEEFLVTNPDIIIVSGGGGMDNSTRDVILDDFMTRPQYASLSAVKNHRVYAVNADAISRAGPRIVDATEQVAADIREMTRTGTGGTAGAVPTTRTPGFCAAGTVLLIAAFVCLIQWRR
ncbi:ABC transporter substrate-binding protein [Methanoregula formicica]|uniref:ABC-type Fe3+-hydroxamate transport system, periplasmic component n=1 Tax=Methanoregula formicica (strain DSM 22288 / NBRC 105244 / SMSP) TaxID=593750 RepID=L0HD68_METFS|nr:cobalamin-binding protein [Methanoregula formicica]AGB01975.1 ABC-type Fe3+-hydroxamate transport system, periplasmic component [Methanoregula formicica SMSP]